jgi:hypothetical protein
LKCHTEEHLAGQKHDDELWSWIKLLAVRLALKRSDMSTCMVSEMHSLDFFVLRLQPLS